MTAAPKPAPKPKKSPRPVKRRNVKRHTKEWLREYGSVERVEFVKRLPCVVCGGHPCDNAHIDNGGSGRKADYTKIVPLCVSQSERTSPADGYTPVEGYTPVLRIWIGCHKLFDGWRKKLWRETFKLEALAAETERRWQRHLQEQPRQMRRVFWWLRIAIKDVFLNLHGGAIVEVVEYCGVCGIRQPLVWWASNPLWQKVTGHSTPTGDNAGGVYCPRCFDVCASELGMLLRWIPEVEWGSEPQRHLQEQG